MKFSMRGWLDSTELPRKPNHLLSFKTGVPTYIILFLNHTPPPPLEKKFTPRLILNPKFYFLFLTPRNLLSQLPNDNHLIIQLVWFGWILLDLVWFGLEHG